jgi:hypothetical protein
MKMVFAVIGIVVVIGSLIADYKWKQWMAERKRDRF